MNNIWCVIPTYNNKDTIESIALECKKYINNVLIVDDGTTDADISNMFVDKDIHVITHKCNKGKGFAIKTALEYIKKQDGRFMITIDADGQHYPSDLEKILPMLNNDDTILIGSRNFEQTKNVPEKSKIGRNIANFWLRVETGVLMNDCQSGFRVYPVKYLSKMHFFGDHYDFETEILTRAVWSGLKLKTIEINVWYPEEEKRISSFKPFLDNLRISLMHTRLIGRHLLPIPHKKLIVSESKTFDVNILKHPIKLIKTLLKENSTPSGLAVSAGIGIFLAVLPIISLHTIVIIYVTSRLHLNKIMACTIQNLCIPPFVPVLCIEVGHYILYKKWLTEISFDIIFKQLPDRIYEWLIGSFIVAPILAVIIGIIVYVISKSFHQKNESCLNNVS